MINSIILKEAIRMYKYNRFRKRKGFRRYEGDITEIITKIIDSCWNNNKKYFMVSSGHFCQFYSRDFFWCCKSLVDLGYKEKVLSTLYYALDIFYKNKKITTSINPNGIPFDFPRYGVDSLPSIVYCVRVLNDDKIIDRYKSFIESEIKRFFLLVIDKKNGLVRRDIFFSSIRDHYKRASSCYDNVMVAMLSNNLNELGINNPFKKYDYQKLIVDNFWNNKEGYFFDNLNDKDDYYKFNNYDNQRIRVTADANLFPFWCDVINNKKMLKRVLENIESNNLLKPFPIKYESNAENKGNIFLNLFAKDYESDSIWAHIAPLFIDLMIKCNKKKGLYYLKEYIKIIELYKNYLEVYNKDGKPFSTFFYTTDESMIWSSIILRIINENRI
jgi:hypothetical protein